MLGPERARISRTLSGPWCRSSTRPEAGLDAVDPRAVPQLHLVGGQALLDVLKQLGAEARHLLELILGDVYQLVDGGDMVLLEKVASSDVQAKLVDVTLLLVGHLLSPMRARRCARHPFYGAVKRLL